MAKANIQQQTNIYKCIITHQLQNNLDIETSAVSKLFTETGHPINLNETTITVALENN